jgi:hypothetical protein
MAPLSLGKKSQKPGDAHGRPVEKSTAHPPGPASILRRRPPARPEQKNEKDAHPPIGRVSQKGRVGARPALSEVLASHARRERAPNLDGRPQGRRYFI